MTEQELQEKIAKLIFHQIHPITDIFPDYWGITNTMDDESWRRLEKRCLYQADQILSLIKERYVELADDQILPEIPSFSYDKAEDRPLLQRGAINYSKLLSQWRKVKITKPVMR